MKSGNRRLPKSFRARAERMEARLVMTAGASAVAAEVRAILNSSAGGSVVRPNTPVLPRESAFAAASFIDPSVDVVKGNRIRVGEKDYVAPGATLDATWGSIKIRSSSSIQDNATLVANPDHAPGAAGIFIGDGVTVGTGATIIGPAAIGGLSKAGNPAEPAVTIGANATIDGAVIEPGSFVGALARVGPGVVLPTGFRVLPGMDVTTDAEADTPSLGMVVAVTSADTSAATAKALIAADTALASGYASEYRGEGATGGAAATGGPIPSPISAAGSTIDFGGPNAVLGASSGPASRFVNFEAAAGTPTFLSAGGKFAPIAINHAYDFPARVIGAVRIDQTAAGAASAFGKSDSIRADEAPFITFAGQIEKLGDHVSIHSPLGRVQTATTTTVVTTVNPAGGTPTTTTTATTILTPGAPTATVGTTTATTTGIDASGEATTGTVSTTVAVASFNLGVINIGSDLVVGKRAAILGGPTGQTAIGDDVSIGAGAVVDTSILGSGVVVGNRALIEDSTIPAGTVVPDGEIIISNAIVGTVLP